MDVLILRLLLDSSFFLAIFNPLISGDNLFMKVGLMAVLAAWIVWLVLNWKKKDLEGRVQDVVFTEVKVLAVIQVYELVILGFSGWQEKCAPFVASFAVVAILFLRVGRLIGGSQEKGKFWGANSVEILAVLGIVLVFSSEIVKNFAWKLLGGFYLKIIFPILSFFLNILQMVFMLLEPLIAMLFSGLEPDGYEVEVDNRTGQDFLQLTGNETLAETPMWAKVVGVLLIVVVFAAVFYFLYQKLSVAGSGRDRKIHGEVKKSTLGVSERNTVKKPSIFDEKNVRYYYRRFLELCRKHGLQPETDMVTSEMMHQIAVERWGEEASMDEFTTLYREVRYGGRKDEEPERKTAKSIYKKIKSAAEDKKTV